WAGIMVTTLARPPAASSPLSVLKLSYLWTALIAVLALASLFIARRERPASRWLLAALALAVLLVPAEQARVDTTVSLHKHVVFGAWFAAMAAGYVLARLSLVDKTRGWAAVVSIPVLAALLLDGLPQATSLFRVWPNATPIVTALPGLLARHPGRYLTSSDLYQVLGYYDGGRASWPQWQSDLHFQVPGAPAGLASDRAAITSGYFSLVIIGPEGGAGTAVDQAVRADMRRAGGYRLVADADGFEAWTPAAAS
ncbi:MAG TPA: hypothetical protein VH478_08185, partial [Trebonia sp.]|nr:hypothetical protein [Trebonia sp.]